MKNIFISVQSFCTGRSAPILSSPSRSDTRAAAGQRLLDASVLAPGDVPAGYGTTLLHGHDAETAQAMRVKFGENVITAQGRIPLVRRLAEAFINPFTVVLFILAGISLATDVIFAAPEEQSLSTVCIIFTMVGLSGILRFIQEFRSDRAAERLKAMVNTTATVIRGGVRTELPLSEVVAGDIVFLGAGDMVPADVRILRSKDLFISQSALTGESEPVEKVSRAVDPKPVDPLSADNLAFAGTNVISGTAVALVIACGNATLLGSLSAAGKKLPTSFEKGVNAVSWVLIRFMLVMVPVVLFINGFTKGSWMEALLFALSVAVGLTPEMLPMIVTVNLAKGAVRMAQKKTVVRKLDAIQNFGAMDVLCTDKTGTLTQDKVVLERYLDIHGNQEPRVLRHAFLNSHFQTGLKNLIDVAILRHAQETDIAALVEKYVKVDEIPFDFNRRRMSVVIRDATGKTQVITKGAVEEMLSVCAFAEYRGRVEPLSAKVRADILSTVTELNREGMRVLAVAQKTNPPAEGAFSVADEADMVLMGYLAFLDPPKVSAAAAIEALHARGVAVRVLTGDSDAVTCCICRMVGLPAEKVLLGPDIEPMDDGELRRAVEAHTVFAKLSPDQKKRIIEALRSDGHVVGFMGDGINDAPALRASDVGISVDTAVDVARESADIILLEKDLMVLEEGVIEGRRIFANIVKYVKMTASSNFGNMFSVLAASAFLPFLPMLPLQILILNFIYDLTCTSLPWDNVDEEYIRTPRRWEAGSIGRFMRWVGPTSSVFDLLTFAILYFLVCPSVLGGAFGTPGVDGGAFAALFQAGWFVESLFTQTLVIHFIRTPEIPFLRSTASMPVLGFTLAGVLFGALLPYTVLGQSVGMLPLPAGYFLWLAVLLGGYMLLISGLKKVYIARYGEWL